MEKLSSKLAVLNQELFLPTEYSSKLVSLPNILLIKWVSYGYGFQLLFDLNKEEGINKYVYWWLSNQLTIKLYQKDILNYFVSRYHVLTIDRNEEIIKPTFLMELIWRNRLDLQIHFPEGLRSESNKYWEWWLNSGSKEYCIEDTVPLDLTVDFSIEDIVRVLISLLWNNRVDLQKAFPEPKTKDKESFLFWWIQNNRFINIYNKEVFNKFIWKYHKLSINRNEEIIKPTFLMELIWRNRLDLQIHFPEGLRSESNKYWEWWLNSGSKEYCIEDTVDFNLKENVLKNNNSLNSVTYVEEIKKIVNNKIAVIGHPTGIFGLGEDARLIVESLKTVGVEVDIYAANQNINCSKIDYANVYDIKDYHGNYLCNIFCLPVFDMLNILTEFGLNIFSSTKNIAIFQWELPNFPKEASFAYKLLDKILAISDFVRDSISKSTLNKVETIFLPFKEQQFTKRSRKYFGLPDEKHFLFFFSFDGGSFIARKNPLAFIESFQRAFKNINNVGCVIKVMNQTEGSIWKECKRRAMYDDRIYIIDNAYSRLDFLALIDVIDVVVSLHRSEGFGRLMAEAFLMEKPVIASSYSGNLDYMKDTNSYLVDGKILPLFKDDYLFAKGNFWFEPDIDHASELMKYVFYNIEEAIEKAKLGKKIIQENYSLKSTGEQLKNIIKGVQE